MDAALQNIEQTGWVYTDILIVVICLAAGLIWLLLAGLIFRNVIRTITDISQSNSKYRHLLLLLTAILLISAFAPADVPDSPIKSSIRYSAGLFNGKFGSKDLYTGKPYTTQTCFLWVCINHKEYPHWDEVERVFSYRGTKFAIESVRKRSAHRYSTIGLRLFAGELHSPGMTTRVRNIDASSEFIILINPYFYKDYKYGGIGAGLSLGKIPVRSANYTGEGLSYNENKMVNLSVSFSFRLLRRDSFFLYGKFNDMDSEIFPQIHNQFGFGFGFFRKNQYGVIRAGISNGGLYLEPDYPVSNRFTVYGRFKMPGHSRDYSTQQTHMSIGVRYSR